MDTAKIISELKAERDRLDRAISALEGGAVRRGRPPKASNLGIARRRTMSAAARAKIAAAQRARWAKQKGATAPNKAVATKSAAANKKAAPAKKSAARKGMSPAARKKLSALMKQRWEARKKAAQSA